MEPAPWWWRSRGVAVALVCACLAAAPAARAAADGPHRIKLAFLGLRPLAGVDKGKAQAVSAYLLDALQNRGAYQVLSPDDVKALLGLEAEKQLLGCNDDSACLAQIAGSLGASRLLEGSLARIGGSILVSITLLDTNKAEAVLRLSRRVRTPSTLEPVLDVIPGIVDQLVAGDPAVRAAAKAPPAAPPKHGAPAAAAKGTEPTAAARPAPAAAKPASPAAKPPAARPASALPRRPRLTVGLQIGGGLFAYKATPTGPSAGGSAPSAGVFGLLRLGFLDVGAAVFGEGSLANTAAPGHLAARFDVRFHVWRLPSVQLYAGAGLRLAPVGLRLLIGGDWPLHVFGREDFAIVTDVAWELYGHGFLLSGTVGLGYSFL